MPKEDADDLVAFQRVRVVRSTATALFCALGDKRVWLPRDHIKGKLWSRGDCGTLLVRRWVALDRHLTVPLGTDAVPTVELSVIRRNNPGQLHVLRSHREVHPGH